MRKQIPVKEGYQPRQDTLNRCYQPGPGNGTRSPAKRSNIQRLPSQAPLNI